MRGNRNDKWASDASQMKVGPILHMDKRMLNSWEFKSVAQEIDRFF